MAVAATPERLAMDMSAVDPRPERPRGQIAGPQRLGPLDEVAIVRLASALRALRRARVIRRVDATPRMRASVGAHGLVGMGISGGQPPAEQRAFGARKPQQEKIYLPETFRGIDASLHSCGA